jgi:hypothetical protein
LSGDLLVGVAEDEQVEVAPLLEVSDQSIYSWRPQELIDRASCRVSSEECEKLRVAL